MMVSGLRQSGSVMGWHKAGWRRNWTIPVNVSCRGLRVGKLPALWISWWNWHRYSEWVRIICCLDIRVLVEMTWKSICQGNQTGRKSMYTGCWMRWYQIWVCCWMGSDEMLTKSPYYSISSPYHFYFVLYCL